MKKKSWTKSRVRGKGIKWNMRSLRVGKCWPCKNYGQALPDPAKDKIVTIHRRGKAQGCRQEYSCFSTVNTAHTSLATISVSHLQYSIPLPTCSHSVQVLLANNCRHLYCQQSKYSRYRSSTYCSHTTYCSYSFTKHTGRDNLHITEREDHFRMKYSLFHHT
jgi:hypothetical protein